MIEDIKKIKVDKVDEAINYTKFSAPTININDEWLSKKMAEKFMQLSPKKTNEVENDVEKDR